MLYVARKVEKIGLVEFYAMAFQLIFPSKISSKIVDRSHDTYSYLSPTIATPLFLVFLLAETRTASDDQVSTGTLAIITRLSTLPRRMSVQMNMHIKIDEFRARVYKTDQESRKD